MYKLREANITDAKLLFEWANDNDVRATAIIKKKIEWKDHLNWLIGKLQSTQSHIYILTEGDDNIGMVRFDKNYDMFIISYSIDKLHRKKGMGLFILQLGIKKISENEPHCNFKATVQIDNTASNKIFEKLGFSLEKEELIEGHIFNAYCKYGNE